MSLPTARVTLLEGVHVSSVQGTWMVRTPGVLGSGGARLELTPSPVLSPATITPPRLLSLPLCRQEEMPGENSSIAIQVTFYHLQGNIASPVNSWNHEYISITALPLTARYNH